MDANGLRGQRKRVTLSNGASVVVRPVNVFMTGPKAIMRVHEDEGLEALRRVICAGVVEPRIVDGPEDAVQDPTREVSIYEIPQGLLMELFQAVADVSGFRAAEQSFRADDAGTGAEPGLSGFTVREATERDHAEAGGSSGV